MLKGQVLQLKRLRQYVKTKMCNLGRALKSGRSCDVDQERTFMSGQISEDVQVKAFECLKSYEQTTIEIETLLKFEKEYTLNHVCLLDLMSKP